ncbi:MAG: hypothetical protein KDA20_04205 [Phycisphaerales bacterium]|nr:hypothetical protein [Phycisphaerales bacterium]
MIDAGPVIPTLVCVPLGMLAMITCAAHLLGPARQAAPASRRRIRQANGFVMLFAIPLLTIGFGVIDPNARPQTWLLTWIAAIALLTMAIGLAFLDVANTMRLHHAARKRLAHSMAQARTQLRANLRLVHAEDLHDG